MKEREIFSTIALVPPLMVRVDGRAFHGLTRKSGLEKPYDSGFQDAFCEICLRLMSSSGLEPLFCYTFSDEISIYFDTLPFGGRLEKIDSVCASYAASAATLALHSEEPLSFDSRVILLTPDKVGEYLTWRQKEAWRNHINAYCQHALIEDGMTSSQAAKALKGLNSRDMHEMMFRRGVNLAKTPAWQRRGTLISRRTVKKEGYNPVTGETVECERRVAFADRDLPLFSTPEGEAYLSSVLD